MEFELNKYTGLIAALVGFTVAVAATPYIMDEITLNHQQQSFDANTSVYDASDAENKSLGIDTSRNLSYGNLPQETNATKFLQVNASTDTVIRVSSSGNMSDHFYYEEKHYFSGEQNIPVEFRGMETGNFTGEIHLDIQTPSNRVGDYWIRYRGDYWPFSHVAENARNRLDLALYRLGV